MAAHHIIPYFLVLSIILAAADDLASDRAALLSLRSSLGGRLYKWNASADNPCSWPGVVCSKSSPRVVELHLPGTGIMGPIPTGVIGNLTALKFLSLRFNALSGTIPPDIFSIPTLQYVYLQHNRLSGEIPPQVFSLSGLVRLNFAHNNLSGQISPDFNKLANLSALFLENNQFTGSLPSSLDIPNLKQLNVSNNHLNGTIPSKLAVFPPNSFQGNTLCGQPLPNSCDNNNNNNHHKKKKLSAGPIAGIVIAALVVALLVALCLFFLCCRKKKNNNNNNVTREIATPKEMMDLEAAAANANPNPNPNPNTNTNTNTNTTKDKEPAVPEQRSSAEAVAGRSNNKKSLVFFGNSPRVFDLDDLLKASAEVLGKGNYGTTYKAALDGGLAVAVKRLKDVQASDEEFKAKMEEIGRLNHHNLVALRAYYGTGQERLLVYDYMPLGSLSALLHGNRAGSRTPLNWETRSMIALGAARGLTYIHSQGPTTSHGNIKSSNILLSDSYEARVSDYGLAHIMSPASGPNRIAGYRAPEVTDPRKVSQKADVYSFGVFILELLTGKAPLMNEEGVDLPRWVQSVVKEEWSAEVFDAELLRYQNVEEEMVQLLQLGVDCAASYPDNRPNMEQVMPRIEEICRSATNKAAQEQGAEDDEDSFEN